MVEQGIGGLWNVSLSEYEIECGFLSEEDAWEYLIAISI